MAFQQSLGFIPTSPNKKHVGFNMCIILMWLVTYVWNPCHFLRYSYLSYTHLSRVPPSVLRKKFSVVSKVFIDLLAANSATSAASLLRSALACLSTVLRVQELAVWSEPSTSLTYQTLLIFTIHHKPKVKSMHGQHLGYGNLILWKFCVWREIFAIFRENW